MGAEISDYLASLRYRPAYFSKGFLGAVVYSGTAVCSLGVLGYALVGQWQLVLMLLFVIASMWVANHNASQPKYYWQLPLGIAVLPSVAVFYIAVRQPLVGAFLFIAMPYFYFSTLHYKRALELLGLVDGAAILLVFNNASVEVALLFTCCLLMITLLLYTMVSTLNKSYSQAMLLATTDELTGLLNRRAFNKKLEEAVAYKDRYPEVGMVMVLMDLDLFKKVNDDLGHSAGDEALVLFADTLRQRIRKVDVLARCGGEEFALLLPNSSQNIAEAILDDCRQQLLRRPFGDGRVLAFSAGIAALQPDEDRDAWFCRCDSALYRAKGSGRGRNCFAS
jgi:diguanylate cyclase (GGDEF)-like protein